jgi:peptidoglycan/LPS O-acetylase OafA/YrhL
MIQRVQTLWMFLAAIIVFLTLKFSFYNGTLAADNTYHAVIATDNFLMLILTSALGTGILINIFLFKNRTVQSRIILLGIILEGVIIFLYIKETNKFSTGSFTLWSAFHILVIIFLIFAARGIYKDSKLIRDSNRLR